MKGKIIINLVEAWFCSVIAMSVLGMSAKDLAGVAILTPIFLIAIYFMITDK
jgi:hypothetical protein